MVVSSSKRLNKVSASDIVIQRLPTVEELKIKVKEEIKILKEALKNGEHPRNG